MDCETCREAISARLDGAADPSELPMIDSHLRTCPACTEWEHSAVQVTRVIRVRPAADAPDLTAAILARAAELPAPARALRGQLWRAALAAVGVAQFTLGAAQLLGVAHSAHGDSGGAHLFNESTAWNIALGIGFTAAAVWPKLAAGLLPTLAVFAVVLTAVSIGDVFAGQVEISRLESHALVLVGLAVLMVVHRRHRLEDGPRERQRLARPERYSPLDAMPDHRSRAETHGQDRGMRPAGRHVA